MTVGNQHTAPHRTAPHRTGPHRTARAVAPDEVRHETPRASSGATLDSPLSSDAFPSESLPTPALLKSIPFRACVKNRARNFQLSSEQSMAPLPPSLCLPFVRKHRQPVHSRTRRLPATLGLRLKSNVGVSIAELDRWSSGTRGQASRFQRDATLLFGRIELYSHWQCSRPNKPSPRQHGDKHNKA